MTRTEFIVDDDAIVLLASNLAAFLSAAPELTPEWAAGARSCSPGAPLFAMSLPGICTSVYSCPRIVAEGDSPLDAKLPAWWADAWSKFEALRAKEAR